MKKAIHVLPGRAVVTGLVIVFLWASTADGAHPAPPFGPSVQFQGGEPALELGDLRGKAVLVIFFQSWCPKCNAWSGKVFNAITEFYANDPSVVLVAMKTDGGVEGGRQYLEERNVDLSKWVLASDASAAYYRSVIPPAPLYYYLLINAKGEMADVGQAGNYWTAPPELAGKYKIATQQYTKSMGEHKSFLNPDQTYHKDLARAVRWAELGQLGLACKMAKRVRSADVKAASEKLVADLNALADQWVQQAQAKACDGDNPDRYQAYLQLDRYVMTMTGMEASRKARSAISKLRRDPVIRNESAARRMYDTVMARIATLQGDQRAQMLKQGMTMVKQKYPNTYYSRLAEMQINPPVREKPAR